MRWLAMTMAAALLAEPAAAQRGADAPLGVIIEAPPRPAEFIRAAPIPDAQARLTDVIERFARRYMETRDSGSRIEVVLGRADALCEASPRGGVQRWVGTVERLQRDVRWVRMTVRLSDRLSITNDMPPSHINFSNIIGHADGFLGPTFAALREGDRIRFSATMQGGHMPGSRGPRECFAYANPSESGRMEQPRLIGGFQDIAIIR